MEEKMRKIVMVLKTGGLEYDDRVRKEILTVKKLFPDYVFDVLVMLDDQNTQQEGITSYGVHYKTVYSPSRDKYPSAKMLLLKSYDFYRVVKDDLKQYDAIWCADIETVFIVLLCGMKNLIWDLHELPTALLNSSLRRFVLRKAFKKCKVVLHANQYRIDYLDNIHALDRKDKHLVVRNFPDFNAIDSEYDETYHRFAGWLGDRKCVYLQGINFDSRAPMESITAVLNKPGLCAVVLGSVNEDRRKMLEEKFGEDVLRERLYIVGLVNQLKTPQYMKKCFMSLIFYKNTRPNNWYCEANRLYQTISMGLLVVTGCNPPMKGLLDEYGFGVAVDTDGSDEKLIEQGIDDLMANESVFISNIKKYRHLLTWDNQEPIIKEAINRLFN